MGFFLVFFGGLSAHLCRVAGARLLRAGSDLAMGRGAVRGAVRLVIAESGAGEFDAAGDYCVWGGVVAGGDCGEGGGVLWEDANGER